MKDAGMFLIWRMMLGGVWLAAAEPMPVQQQNALVRKYCSVCHTDAARNGGLSLESFDAARAAPSLLAMMLSKLTGGVLLATAQAAHAGGPAAELVTKRTKSGAMGAAGIPIPDQATVDALIDALAKGAKGAEAWTIEREGSGVLVASVLREARTAENEAEAYRIIVSCTAKTRVGSMQLAWSPAPQRGSLLAVVDGNAPASVSVTGGERMGNGSDVVATGAAAIYLADTRRSGLRMPQVSLVVRELFPGQTVEFSFAGLPVAVRQELAACFD